MHITRSTDNIFQRVAGSIQSPLDESTSQIVGATLNSLLVDLIDVSLQGKQMHWNLTGPEFPTLHAKLDEIVDLARSGYDTIAERSIQLGVPVNGMPEVVAQSSLPNAQAGFIDGQTALRFLSSLLLEVAHRIRGAIQTTGQEDLLTQDILFQIGEDFEKQHWMINAQIV